MPAKKTTIATAEKRVIKAEIATLKRASRKVASDHIAAHKKLAAEQRRINRDFARLDRSEQRAGSAIARRLAILEGRL